jgi:hypothetical protein
MNGGSGNDQLDGAAGTDTAVFDAAFQSLQVTSSGSLVTFNGSTGQDVVKNTEVFEFADRTIVQADGAPTVDDLFYLSRNTDVLLAGVDADAHFALYGWREGRDPNAYFDTSGYLAAYGDVAAAGVNPLQHYLAYGWKEGRDPSANFDTKAYLAANPDVAAAGVDPLSHFLLFGAGEGRAAQAGDGAFAVAVSPGVYV